MGSRAVTAIRANLNNLKHLDAKSG